VLRQAQDLDFDLATYERTALPTEFFCPLGFLCGRPIGLELIARVSERPGRRQRQFQETVKDVAVCNVLMHGLVVWHSGYHIGFDQRGSSMSDPVSTEMVDWLTVSVPDI